MMKIKAVLFDFDGTIRDIESIIYSSLAHVLTTHGVDMPSKEELAPYLHHHNFVHEKFAPHVSREQFREVYYDHKGKMMPTVELFADVHDALGSLKKDYLLGLVTAARSYDLDLERLGIADMFDVIIGGDQLTEHKPHPEGIQKALKQLKLQPSEAVYVGDMPTDVHAGSAADLAAVIGVSYGFMEPEILLAAGASTVVDSLQDLRAAITQLEK